MRPDTEADTDALGLLLDLVEEEFLPSLPDGEASAVLAAVLRARRLRALLCAGRVLVLTEEDRG